MKHVVCSRCETRKLLMSDATYSSFNCSESLARYITRTAHSKITLKINCVSIFGLTPMFKSNQCDRLQL